MSLITLKHSTQGRPILVDAATMAAVDVTPLPTRKMQRFLNEQDMRIIRRGDGFHIGECPTSNFPEAA